MVTPATSARVNNATALLNASSSVAVEDTLSRMRYRFRRWDRWLTAKHPYANVVSALDSSTFPIDGRKLAEYIAASIPLHVADGWTFLARAFDSIRAGDRGTAVHLAYYAELRAAMSLLASEGVGVFSRRHVSIDQAFVPTAWSTANTHQATWDLLRAWADQSARVATLLTSIKVESRTIDEWFQEMGITQSVQHLVAREWLQSWSIDLTYFPENDHAFRNEVSYRPSRISPHSTVALNASTDIIDPVLRTWDALEPSSDSGGASIDRALLFRALVLAKNESSFPSDSWNAFVERLHGIASASLETQLKDPKVNEYYVLKWADNSSTPPPMQAVLSRATLLLRIANGICAQRLARARVTKQDLHFWWNNYGQDSGLWAPHADPDSFADLWQDVDDARGELESSLASAGTGHSMSELGQLLGRGVALTQFSRTPLWLFGVD